MDVSASFAANGKTDLSIAPGAVAYPALALGPAAAPACPPALALRLFPSPAEARTSQEAAIEALVRGEDAMKKMRDQYHRRRDLVVRRFNEIGLKCHAPRGSFYAFPDVTASGLTEKNFAVGLLEKEKVAVVPGTAFGINGTGHVRACFATGYEQLITACDRIGRFVQGQAR